jgi:drug/metabolite transporter (DMT)-like permease
VTDGSQLAAKVAAFAAIYLIWGSTYLAIAVGVETIPPLLLIAVRCLVAGVLLYGFARWRGAAPAGPSAWKEAWIAGALLFFGGQGALAWAEQRVPSGTAALLLATTPMFVALLGWSGGAIAGGRAPARLGAMGGAGLLLGLVGVGSIVGGSAGGTPLDLLGVAALLFAAMSWAAGTMLAGSAHDPSPERRAATHLIAGGTLLLAASLLTGEVGGLDLGRTSARSLLALAYLTVFGTLVAYRAFVWLLSRTDPAKVASHAYVNPAVAVFLGGTVGGETLAPTTMLGAAVIVLSVIMLVTRRKDPTSMTRRHGASVILQSRV